MKYQLAISVGKAADKNSASTKAVQDCSHLFSLRNYENRNLFFPEETGSVKRYLTIFAQLVKFYLALESNSIIAIQYPMLNNVFKYFIKAARIKRAKFFCVVHDIESLRLGGQKKNLVSREAANLNYYDCLIVHNNYMRQWLKDKGITTKIVSLGLFDYLLKEAPTTNNNINLLNTVVFAGNLAKSNFIYSLSEIPNWNFNVYGPNYKANKQQSPNVVWGGEYSPEEVVYKLKGNFGLIWDGEKIDECDQVLGNYLRYNNPHKFSLYIAAGMPVIAPKDSAIAKIITDLKIGILVDSLIDLERLQLNESDYKVLQFNCRKVQNEIINGNFFLTAISAAEKLLAAS